MSRRNKRIFISDVHLSDERSMGGPYPYGWLNKNIPRLSRFLDDQLQAPEVKEVVILGDLFDNWIIPAAYDPLADFDRIVSNRVNKPVIDRLIDLAGSPDVKLAYVPGNHDMAQNGAGLSDLKQFMAATFPGIRYFCENKVPLAAYTVGTLTAEHGNRYCLFNAPDLRTDPKTYLPLGYFISRMITSKVATQGSHQNPHAIFFKWLKKLLNQSGLLGAMIEAIASDAGLSLTSTVKVGISGLPPTMTVKEIRDRYLSLILDWNREPGKVEVGTAIVSDLENLSFAAGSIYFLQRDSKFNIVIFGHTHVPDMVPGPPVQSGDRRHDGQSQ